MTFTPARSKYVFLFIFQLILIILFGVFVRYDTRILSQEKVPSTLYAMFQDVHVMIFIGFGFLMTFLRRYGYSSLGFNWLLGVLVVQWAIICQNLYHLQNGYIIVSIQTLIEADIMAATILISMGAVLGRTTGPQLIFMAIIETAVCCSSLYLVTDVFKTADAGGSIAIHTFGAYFGLAVSLLLRQKKSNQTGEDGNKTSALEGPSYSSDITAMIGSIFLWIFWPSFNAALCDDEAGQYRAIVNTYLSLAAAALSAFVTSHVVSKEGKFDMVHVQNSTLAGGVAVGSIANMMLQPYGALLLGTASGTFSVLGYHYLTPKLETCCGLKDTCGVHNLHGMPGVLSGLLSALLAYLASSDQYGDGLSDVFPAMTKEGRSAQTQALYQLAGLGTTLGVALISGFVTGSIMKSPMFEKLNEEEKYNDTKNWELPSSSEDIFKSV